MNAPTRNEALELADKVGGLIADLPDGIGLVIFLIADMGASYESSVVSSLRPAQFAPVLRDWLARYDRGEASGLDS